MFRKITSQIHFSKCKEKEMKTSLKITGKNGWHPLSSTPLLQFRLVVPLPWDELLDGFLSMLSLVCGISPNKLLACFAHLFGSLASHHRWVSRKHGEVRKERQQEWGVLTSSLGKFNLNRPGFFVHHNLRSIMKLVNAVFSHLERGGEKVR